MPQKYRILDNGQGNAKKPGPKRPASHQRQIAVNRARDKKALELGGIQGKMGITRTYPKMSNESEWEWTKRIFMQDVPSSKDIKNKIGSATKTVKKIVKKLNG